MRHPAAALEPLTFDSTDVGQVEHVVSSIYSKMRIGATGTHTRAQIARRLYGSHVAFDDLAYSFDIGYSADPPDRLIICDVISSTIDRYDRRSTEVGTTFGPGDQFLISMPGLPYGGLAHAPRLRFTLLDPAVLDRVAARDDPTAPSVRFLDHRPVSRHAQHHLQRCIAFARDDLVSMDGPAANELLASSAAQLLAAGVLRAYPNTATRLTRHDESDARTGVVARAVAFIETNPDVDLSVGDIARVAHVTPRALQLAFRRQLDTTPLAYVRRVRLDHARRDLQEITDPGAHTVAGVAARWGFTPGWFAKQYRDAYGETPSRTLRG